MSLIPWREKQKRESRGESSPLAQLRTEMDHLLDKFMREPLAGLEWPFGSQSGWSPAVDVAEDEQEITVRAEVPGLKGRVLDVDPHLLGLLDDGHAIGRRAAEGLGAEILNEHDLSFGHAGAGGYNGATDPHCTLQESESSGEQAHAVRILQYGVRSHFLCPQSAGHTVGPLIQVIRGVRSGDRFARST